MRVSCSTRTFLGEVTWVGSAPPLQRDVAGEKYDEERQHVGTDPRKGLKFVIDRL